MANPKRRSASQVAEDISVRILRQKLPATWVIHDYKPDYGIDCVVELFEEVIGDPELAETLGEHFYVQLKSTRSAEYTTRRAYARRNVAKGFLVEDKSDFTDIDVINFRINVSDLLTTELLGPAVPVLLILIDLSTERAFFVCLNDYLEKIIQPEDPSFSSKDSKLVQIPVLNEVSIAPLHLVPLRAYAKRAKMYGAFNRFTFQQKEIQRRRGLARVAEPSNAVDDLEMLRIFVEAALRQDIWRGHDFWEPVGWSRNDLEGAQQALSAGVATEDVDTFKEFCDEYVWGRLVNLGNMYEELVREWFLPTELSRMLSYPDFVAPTTDAG